MSKEAFIKPDNKTKDKTKGWKLFHFDYPPFPFGTRRTCPACKASCKAHLPETLLLAYYHVPFCGSVVTFAIFAYIPIRTPKKSGRYLSATLSEFQSYADSPYIAGRKPKFIYFGGGTLLSVRQAIDRAHR